MASPILRETIKKLKDRRALLQRQIKGPLAELQQIEEDLKALGAAPSGNVRRVRSSAAPKAARAPRTPAAPRGAHQAAILRAIRNGATTAEEIAAKTEIAGPAVSRAITTYATKSKLVVSGPNGLTLTKAGREKLAELEAV